MKLTVKTLKGSHFQIEVQPSQTIMAVKKNIEDAQGKELYPCGQQLLIHNGKVLKDETTLADNKVTEDGFLVVMLSKSKILGSAGASSTQSSCNPPTTALPATAPPTTTKTPDSIPAPEAPVQIPVPADSYGQAASYLVSGNNVEQTIQQIMDMGGGSWDRETVSRALRAAFNNPERAVDYLYSEIPETAEVPVPEVDYPASQAPETDADASEAVSRAPNTAPLNMFPQMQSGDTAGQGSLDFLRDNPQFQALRDMVQANPQILQPMLQELGKQNPNLLRLIQQHQAEFLHLINEPIEGSESELFDQPEQEMPHAISVTPAEQEAIRRLEALGFHRALVIEAFFACDRNEELAANYLLENAGDFED